MTSKYVPVCGKRFGIAELPCPLPKKHKGGHSHDIDKYLATYSGYPDPPVRRASDPATLLFVLAFAPAVIGGIWSLVSAAAVYFNVGGLITGLFAACISPYALRFYRWFPTVARLKRENDYLRTMYNKQLKKIGHTSEYR